MNAVVETLEGLKRKIKVIVPTEDVQEAYQKRLKEIAKEADLKGFRRGKVPVHVIKKKFRTSIDQEVAGFLMEQSFKKAVEDNDLRIAGNPDVHPHEFKEDQQFEYEATFEVYPDIELHDLEGEQLEKLVAEVSNQNVTDMLEKLSKQHANWEKVERAAEEGDRVQIDFEGFIDDKPFEGGKAEKFTVELGSKQMIPGFEEGLIGAKINDSLDLKVNFPEEYPVKDLAGKPAVFKVTVHEIQQAQIPAIDDELAKKIGIDGGVEELRKEAKQNMQKELDRVIEAQLKTAVLDKLLEKNTVLLPEALIESEIKHLQHMALQQMAIQQGEREIPEVDLPREPFIQEAHKRVSLGLLLAEVIKAYDIKLDEDRVHEKIEEIAKIYKNPQEIIAGYYKNKNLLSEIEAAVLEEQVVEKLIEKATISEKAANYDEVMEKANRES